MQQIERVGVVALLFLIVTIVVVAFWDDGRSPESTRVAERDARRDAPSVEERVRADERGLRDDGRVAARQDRERLRVPVGGGDDGIPRPRTDVTDAERADRIARSDEARRARRAERERAEAERAAGTRDIAYEFSRAGSPAEEEKLLRRGYSNQPVEPAPRARIAGPATVRQGEAPSRKRKPEVRPAQDAVAGIWVVESGESLERIAGKALGDKKRWPEIAKLNGLEDAPDRIFVGQELRLPGGAAPAQEPVRESVRESMAKADMPTPPKAAPPAAGGREYVVEKGDMLSVIAQQELGSAKRWKEIAALNPKVDPDRLLVGTRLRLPAGTPARSAESRLVAHAGGSNYRVR